MSLSVFNEQDFLTTTLQIAPLLFDTVVTFMTIWKAFTIRRRNGGPSSRLIQTFLREGTYLHQCSDEPDYVPIFSSYFVGVFYYILISIANLVCIVVPALPSLARTEYLVDQRYLLPSVCTISASVSSL